VTGGLFEPRIPLRTLAMFCRRLATQLAAGVDIRRILERERDSAAPGAFKRNLEELARQIQAGQSFEGALPETGEYFPVLFRDLVHLGEETGRLDSVLDQLAVYYEHLRGVRRGFLAAITWPAIQLIFAVCVVGFLIWILGVIAPAGGEAVDILGFGLIGTSGLFVYCLFLAAVGGAGFACYHAIRAGALWGNRVQKAMLRVPAVGGALHTLALARVAWAMNLTFGAGLDVVRSIRLSLATSGNAFYDELGEPITDSILQGNSVYEAFSSTGRFPREFLDTLQAGEQGGRITESMGLLARQYQEYARDAIKILATIGGFAVWAMVAAILVFLILRIAMFYVGSLYSLM
jgi:type II secretory pathway component PulF